MKKIKSCPFCGASGSFDSDSLGHYSIFKMKHKPRCFIAMALCGGYPYMNLDTKKWLPVWNKRKKGLYEQCNQRQI